MGHVSEESPKHALNKGSGERPQHSGKFLAALKQNLALLGELYRQEITPLMGVGYLEALSDLSVGELNRGCALAIKRCGFLPTPAEIRSLLKEPTGGEMKSSSPPDCVICSGTGYRLIEQEHGYRFATKCAHDGGRKAPDEMTAEEWNREVQRLLETIKVKKL